MLVFVSDVHLTKPQTKKYETFLSLLKECRDNDKIEQLFLVGDIFDLWLGHKSFFFKKHEILINLLKEVALIKKVHIFEGNHDFHFKKKWWNKYSIEIHKNNYQFTYKNKKWLVCHGDLLNKKDYGYRFLRFLFRLWISKFIIFLLPGSVLNFIGETLSTTGSKSSKIYGSQSEKDFLKKWRFWIKELKKREDFDVFLCGHYHVRLMEEIEGVETYNTGSWLDKNYRYLVYDASGPKFNSAR